MTPRIVIGGVATLLAGALGFLLSSVDRAIARIAEAAEHAPRPYELVVLSDHGQSQGATFLQRYGESLEGLVQRVCRTDVHALSAEEDEALGRVGAALTEAARAPGAGGHGSAPPRGGGASTARCCSARERTSRNRRRSPKWW